MNQAAHKMSTEFQIARDPEGYLLDPLDWDESLACQLAVEERYRTRRGTLAGAAFHT
jgi:sulfur relay (sulfurtransferase) DsrC/TusE family protein